MARLTRSSTQRGQRPDAKRAVRVSLQDKINSLLAEVRDLNICSEQADAVREAAGDYDRKSRTRRAEAKNAVNSGLGVGLGAVGAILCMITQKASFFGQFVCWVAGVGTIGQSTLSGGSDIDALHVADEELRIAERKLDDALTALCRCIKSHMQR